MTVRTGLVFKALVTVALLSSLGLSTQNARADDQRVIRTSVTVDAPRNKVWKTWTTTKGVTTFFSPHANVDLRLGGPFEIYFAQDSPPGKQGSEGCKVLSYVENEMLSFTWNAPPQYEQVRGKHTFVVLEFEDADEGKTRVKLTHGGWREGDQWDKVFAYFQKAWPNVLANLKRRFERGPLWEDSTRKMESNRPDQSYWCYFLKPARDGLLDAQTEAEQNALRGHVQHLTELLNTDTLVVAGPCPPEPVIHPQGESMVMLDLPTPGIVIFKAADKEAAREIMEGDPAVKAGVFKATLRRFNRSFWRGL